MTTRGNNNGLGTLYGIGVGPGDPDLLTIKAKRALENVSVVSFTQLDDGKESFALNVAREAFQAVQPTLIAITLSLIHI